MTKKQLQARLASLSLVRLNRLLAATKATKQKYLADSNLAGCAFCQEASYFCDNCAWAILEHRSCVGGRLEPGEPWYNSYVHNDFHISYTKVPIKRRLVRLTRWEDAINKELTRRQDND